MTFPTEQVPSRVGMLAQCWLPGAGCAGCEGLGNWLLRILDEPGTKQHDVVEPRLNTLNYFLLTHKCTHELFSFNTNNLKKYKQLIYQHRLSKQYS